jgi:AcrR family transcriptional regulator
MARPKSDIDIRILHAARARFLTQGVDGASLRAIAKDAGTNIGMVYYYFPSKDDLFLAVVEEVYERVLADLSTALGPDVPVAARIERLYTRVNRLDGEELMVLRLVVREALVSSTRLERLVERFRRGHIPLVLRTIADGVADGTLDRRRHPLLLLTAMVALGTVPQFVGKVLAGKVPFGGIPEGSELVQELVGLLLEGIGGRSSGLAGQKFS